MTDYRLPSLKPPPVDLIRPEGWRALAACNGHPSLPANTWDDSLQDGPEPGRTERIAAAVAVCKTCPVRVPCLDDVDLRFDEGVRGGVDLREWRAVRRRAGKAAS